MVSAFWCAAVWFARTTKSDCQHPAPFHRGQPKEQVSCLFFTMYYILISHEQTAATSPTLEGARQTGQALCDAEPIPATFSIYDEEENWVEDIKRSDGRDLSQQIADFNRAHAAR